jgi:hypothetical protein
MSPDVEQQCGSVRSAAVVNEDIRALIRSTGRRLTDEERTLLEGLYVEWAAAVRREIVEAA